MCDRTISKMLVPLLAVCCLVPLAALAAVLYLAAPVWFVAPAGLLILVLLARRLTGLLAADDGPGSSGDFPAQQGRSPHDHHPSSAPGGSRAGTHEGMMP